MLVNPGVENIKERCEDEFKYLVTKYPTVAFNTHNWVSGLNSPSRGKTVLLATEGYITIPENYDPHFIKRYNAFITSNGKFKKMHPDLNIFLMNGVGNWADYFQLDSFLSYDQKIKGICSLQTIYHTGREGDINHLKHEVMCNLVVEPDLLIHTYGPTPFGKLESQRPHLKFNPGHYENLKKINEYLFCWCPESTYHPLWSYGHLTERLFNCFKSRTIAIYYGCYNIEELVPVELFIDFRNFENDLPGLSKFLIELSKDEKRYVDIVENAYEWSCTNKIGSIMELEKLLQNCAVTYRGV